MAKATSTITEVPVTTYTRKKVIVLELSMKEAQALRMVCSLIGGDPCTSSRKYMNDIRNALDEEGSVKDIFPLVPDYCNVSSSIYFCDKV